MNEVNYLFELVNKFLNNIISLQDFSDKYENYLLENEDTVYSNREAYIVFDGIREDIAYLVLDESLIMENENYIDEKEFRNRLIEKETLLKKILNIQVSA